MEEVVVTTVGELIELLKTVPEDTIVCGSDSGFDGVSVSVQPEHNFVMFSDNWKI